MGRSAAAACYAAPKEPPADLSSAYAPTHLAGATARIHAAAARASPGPLPRERAPQLETRRQRAAAAHPRPRGGAAAGQPRPRREARSEETRPKGALEGGSPLRAPTQPEPRPGGAAQATGLAEQDQNHVCLELVVLALSRPPDPRSRHGTATRPMATGAVKRKPRERQKEKAAVALLHNGSAAQLRQGPLAASDRST